MRFVVFSKRSVIAVAVAVAVMAGIVAAACVSASVRAVASNGMTIVIDPGHGGADGGVVGTDTGKKEADVNLGISLSLRHFLREAGYTVVMTRDSDVDLASPGESFKQSDMRRRKEIIEQAQPDLVVSVHQNYYPLRSVSGAQVFYFEGAETSADYAERMQNILNAALDCDRAAKSADYYILGCTPYPGVLVECGFMSNAREESLLVTPEYQRKVAYAVYSGIVALLEWDSSVAREARFPYGAPAAAFGEPVTFSGHGGVTQP